MIKTEEEKMSELEKEIDVLRKLLAEEKQKSFRLSMDITRLADMRVELIQVIKNLSSALVK